MEYKNFNHTLFYIILGQCDETSKCEVKILPDFEVATMEHCSVKLLNVISKVAWSGSYGTKTNPVYQIVNEHQITSAYWQEKNKDITGLGKDMTFNYDSLVNLTWELTFGTKTMDNLLEKNLWDPAWPDDMMEYFFTAETDRTVFNKAYKQ